MKTPRCPRRALLRLLSVLLLVPVLGSPAAAQLPRLTQPGPPPPPPPPVSHRLMQLAGPLSEAEMDALDAVGPELLLKADELSFVVSIPTPSLVALQSLPFVQLLPVPPELKLSDTLDAIRRILDPGDPNYQCALTGDGQHPCPGPLDPIALHVVFYPDVAFADALVRLAALGLSTPQTRFLRGGVVLLDATNEHVWPLSQLEEVLCLEEELEGGPANDNVARTSRIDWIRSGPYSGYDLTGEGVTIGLWEYDNVVRITHDDFSDGGPSRVALMEYTGPFFGDHSTHVAGTLVGDGDSDPLARGMAPEAEIRAWDVSSDWDEMGEEAQDGNIQVSNHSYSFHMGWNPPDEDCNPELPTWWGRFHVDAYEDHRFGKYRARSRSFDSVVFDTELIVVVSAGNDRDDAQPPLDDNDDVIHNDYGYDCAVTAGGTIHRSDGDPGGYDTIKTKGAAKNVITVGAVADSPVRHEANVLAFSNFGPTDDGRIKPDLVANGEQVLSTGTDDDTDTAVASGTSMATPGVAGAATLLLEHWSDLTGGGRPRAATMRGLMIHTAIESGSAPGPDYRHGWGLLDAGVAAEFMEYAANGSSRHEILEEEFTGGADVYLRYAYRKYDLRVTLAWTDPALQAWSQGTDDRARALINDLDLRVVSADGQVFHPWTLDPDDPAAPARRDRRNEVDNVEQVVVRACELQTDLAQPYVIEVTFGGNYLVRGRQEYTLVVETAAVREAHPWINELHYDNTGMDFGEFVEVAGPAGTDLAGWTLYAYDGASGAPYASMPLFDVIPDQASGMGTLAFPFFGGLQDGAPDGLALIDAFGQVIDLIAYEGAFQTTAGPAQGRHALDIDVSEDDSTPLNSSLQLGGQGSRVEDFLWQPSQTRTPGSPNLGQVLEPPCGG